MQYAPFLRPANMKQLLLALLLPGTLFVQAQTGKDTLYAFRQRISPGIKKAGDIDENGKLIKKTSPDAIRYTIYLSSPSKVRIYPILLWINEEGYTAEADTILHPPELPNNILAPAAKTRYLFPETTGILYRLTPKQLVYNKNAGKGRSLAARNAVVLYYKKAGTMHYEVLKKLTDIEAAALQ